MNDPHLYEYFERRFGQIQTAARRVSFDYRNMNYLLYLKIKLDKNIVNENFKDLWY